jgi:heme iron utilization protein
MQTSHAGPRTDSPTVPEPSFAERARTLLHVGRVGGLSTHSLKEPGYPFGSVMPYALDDHGRPIFLISTMAMHTQNLRADPRAALLVTQSDFEGDVLGASRVTLVGDTVPVEGPDRVDARRLYLARHENSKYWVDFDDFFFYRMKVVDVYYVGGFGVMGWVNADDYSGAKPDPLSDTAAGILQHMNADHSDALIVLASVLAGIEAQEVEMTSVDRLGFNIRAKTEGGMRGSRIAFLREVRDTTETRKVIVEMVQQARQVSEVRRTNASPGGPNE